MQIAFFEFYKPSSSMFQIVMDSLESIFIKIEIFTNLAMGNVIGMQPLGRFDMGQRIYTVSLVIAIQKPKRIVTNQFFDRDGFRPSYRQENS